MSPKHIVKSYGSFIVLTFTLVLWYAMCLIFGAVTAKKQELSHLDLKNIKVQIPESVSLQLEDGMTKLKTLVEETEEVEVKVVTGPALYSQYVDEITSTIYTDLDPVRVKAIIYHESRYQPDIVNPKTGVIGLMQISPKWHTKRARNLGVTDLKDPYGNILVGCDILHEMMQGHGIDYATSVFAGGYKYANSYKNGVSPYVKDIRRIEQKLRTGELVIGGD